MAEMGTYCKAYTIDRFRQYANWKENLDQLRKEKQAINGKTEEIRRELGNEDHFYLQENYVVTDDIFIDENIIFDAVTPEWIDFCKYTLKFEVPNFDIPIEAKAEETGQNLADDGAGVGNESSA